MDGGWAGRTWERVRGWRWFSPAMYGALLQSLTDGAEIDLGIDRQILRQADFLTCSHGLECTNEAGGVACSKQLLGVGARAAAAGGGQLNVQLAIIAARRAFAASCGVSACGVEHFVQLLGHGISLGYAS